MKNAKNSENDSFGLYKERLKLVNELRNEGFNVEFMAKLKPDFRDQINYAEDRDIPFMLILGDDEIQNNTVNLRRLTLTNDIVILKDKRKGKIIEISQPENEKWPIFMLQPLDAKQFNKPKKQKKTKEKKI